MFADAVSIGFFLGLAMAFLIWGVSSLIRRQSSPPETIAARPQRSPAEELRAIADAEIEDGQQKIANSGYWGPVGPLVAAAAFQVKDIFESHLRVSLDLKCDALMVELAWAKRRFAQQYDDDDGFGAATFHQAMQKLEDLRQRRGLPGILSREEALRRVAEGRSE